MQKQSKIYFTIALIGVVALAGYFFGFHVLKKEENSTTPTTVSAKNDQTSDASAQNEAKNSAPVSKAIPYQVDLSSANMKQADDYIISDRLDLKATSPSVGPLIKSIDVTFDVEKQRLILNEKTAGIQAGQRVLFYNQDDSLHLQDASVAFITTDEETKEKVATLNLNGELDKEIISEKAQVITMQTASVTRLPLSALIKTEQGHFLIKATPLDQNKEPTSMERAEQYLLEKIPTKLFLNDGQFFELDYRMLTNGLYLTNPDAAIENNTIVSFLALETMKALKADPLYEARMKSAIKTAKEETQEIALAAAECKAKAEAVVPLTADNDLELSNPGQDCSANSSGSCGIAGGTDAAALSGAPSCGGGGGGAGACGGGGAGACGGGGASACGGGQPPPTTEDGATMIDPYILLGIERLPTDPQ